MAAAAAAVVLVAWPTSALQKEAAEAATRASAAAAAAATAAPAAGANDAELAKLRAEVETWKKSYVVVASAHASHQIAIVFSPRRHRPDNAARRAAEIEALGEKAVMELDHELETEKEKRRVSEQALAGASTRAASASSAC